MVTKLVIDRKTWLRGESAQDSYLVRPKDGKKCCLGFFGEQIGGLTTEQLKGARQPNEVITLAKAFQSLVEKRSNHFFCNEIARDLMGTNDEPTFCGKVREEKLTELFKQIEIEVEFIN